MIIMSMNTGLMICIIIIKKYLRKMKKVLIQHVIFIALLAISSCKENYRLFKYEGPAQGSRFEITFLSTEEKYIEKGIDSIFEAVDNSMSLYNAESLLSEINNKNNRLVRDSIFLQCFSISKNIYSLTKGAFDPTVGPFVDIWGFGAFKEHSISDSIIDSLLRNAGFDKVNLVSDTLYIKQHVKLDFNAVAQGYTVDLIGTYLLEKGIHDFLIEIGGEVAAQGNKPGGRDWIIGIEKPILKKDKKREAIFGVKLKNKAIATAGSYRKFYIKDGKRYSHTINPKTGKPVEHNLLSVSVIADECAEADALATAFMVMGYEKAIEFLETHTEYQAFFIVGKENGMEIINKINSGLWAD